MTRERGQKIGECVYCGLEKPITDDHVPAKNLFVEPRPDNLITVPSCYNCNSSFQRDDVYFRNIILTARESFGHPEAFKLWDLKIKPSIHRPESIGLVKYTFDSLIQIDMYSKGGIYLGQTPAYNADLNRIKAVINRIVRGLYYFENRNRLPSNVMIRTVMNPSEEQLHESLISLFNELTPKIIGKNVFSYRMQFFDEEPFASIWYLIFFDAFLFLSTTINLDDENC